MNREWSLGELLLERAIIASHFETFAAYYMHKQGTAVLGKLLFFVE